MLPCLRVLFTGGDSILGMKEMDSLGYDLRMKCKDAEDVLIQKVEVKSECVCFVWSFSFLAIEFVSLLLVHWATMSRGA